MNSIKIAPNNSHLVVCDNHWLAAKPDLSNFVNPGWQQLYGICVCVRVRALMCVCVCRQFECNLRFMFHIDLLLLRREGRRYSLFISIYLNRTGLAYCSLIFYPEFCCLFVFSLRINCHSVGSWQVVKEGDFPDVSPAIWAPKCNSSFEPMCSFSLRLHAPMPPHPFCFSRKVASEADNRARNPSADPQSVRPLMRQHMCMYRWERQSRGEKALRALDEILKTRCV